MSRAAGAAARALKLMVGRAIIELANDATKMQAVQVSLLDDEVRDNVERFQNYGFTSVPLPGAEGIALAVGSDRDHVVLVAVDDRRFRKLGLQPGETCVYTKWGDFILLKENEIEVHHSAKIRLVAPVTAIEGNLTVTGTIVAQGDVTGNGKTLSTHRHSGVQTGGGNTGTPI